MNRKKKFKEMTSNIRVDPSLDEKYGNEIIFKEKHEKAKEMLKKHPIPKEFLQKP